MAYTEATATTTTPVSPLVRQRDIIATIWPDPTPQAMRAEPGFPGCDDQAEEGIRGEEGHS